MKLIQQLIIKIATNLIKNFEKNIMILKMNLPIILNILFQNKIYKSQINIIN